jgi:hypothetical protein
MQIFMVPFKTFFFQAHILLAFGTEHIGPNQR